MDAEKVFGEVLRKLRHERKLSQEQLAFDSELNRQFVSLLELGERSPSLETLYKLANGLGLSGSDLLKHVESHAQQPVRKNSAGRKPRSAPRKQHSRTVQGS